MNSAMERRPRDESTRPVIYGVETVHPLSDSMYPWLTGMPGRRVESSCEYPVKSKPSPNPDIVWGTESESIHLLSVYNEQSPKDRLLFSHNREIETLWSEHSTLLNLLVAGARNGSRDILLVDTVCSSLESYLSGWEVFDGDEVQRYLGEHPAVAQVLPEALEAIGQYFDSNYEAWLEVVCDPEDGNEELFIVIKTDMNAENSGERFDELVSQWFINLPVVRANLLAITEESI